MRWWLALATLVAAACHGQEPAGPGDGCNPACGAGQACRYDTCVAQPTACARSTECSGDQYCDPSAKECLPWGLGPGGTSDPTCKNDAAPGVFFPGVQCEWLGPPAGDAFPDHVNVLATPMVAAFGPSSAP